MMNMPKNRTHVRKLNFEVGEDVRFRISDESRIWKEGIVMKLSPLTIQGTNILSILEGWKSIETKRSNVRKIKTNKRFAYWSDPELIPEVKVKVMQHLMMAKEELENIGKDLNFISD